MVSRGVLLVLKKSYFSKRYQSVKYGIRKSTVARKELGVIQVSENGALFYDIYSNGFRYLCTEKENMLADDTCHVYTSDDFQKLIG